ncbi:transposable element Tcb1 transposase [Trichonephila clavipes]|nr:transposable element Tcb1 transposase [Trichonephila clavipes]
MPSTQILDLANHLKKKDIRFCWIPGHAGITGNELADTAARSATGSSERFPIPHSDLKACFRLKLQSVWQSNWDQQTENKLHSIMPILAPTAPSLSNRREQVIWTRLRLGPTRLTHRHLLLGEPPPYCEKCNVSLSEDFGKRNMPGKRARRHSSQLSEFERGLIIGMKTAGWSTRRVAGQVDRSEYAVRNCWEQGTREGIHARKTGSGATRKITRREDQRIVRQALVDPTVTHSTIGADIGVAIVPQTISRHLAEANLKSKRPFRAHPLTPEHRQLRLQWCQARSMWNVTVWQKVVFRDESRFVLGTDDNRVRVWRRPGERYNSPHTALRHTARTAGVMVWGAIAYDSRSTLIVMRGTLTGQRYVEDILRPHVGPFLTGLPGAKFSSKIMLVCIQQELLETSYVIFRLFHGRPAPPICPPV